MVAGFSRRWAQQQRMLHGGVWPQRGPPGRKQSLAGTRWSTKMVRQGRSHQWSPAKSVMQLARARKAFPLCPDRCVSLLVLLRGKNAVGELPQTSL